MRYYCFFLFFFAAVVAFLVVDPRNLPLKFGKIWVRNRWYIAGIEVVVGGVKSFSCQTQLLSSVAVQLGLWQYQPPNITQSLFSIRNLCHDISFQETRYECFSMFTFWDMKLSMKYPCFRGFNTPNFKGPQKLKYSKMFWIWPPTI